jgi:CheY-like chemotaxis protein
VEVLARRISMHTILSVGEDFDLLRTRADVLRRTGANVLCASGGSALKFIGEWEFDLIVLCHTVRQSDARRITEAAHSLGGKTLVLLVVTDRTQELEYSGIRLDARTFVEPDCLIRSATDLLTRNTRSDLAQASRDEQMKVELGRKKPESCPADISVRRAMIAQYQSRRVG